MNGQELYQTIFKRRSVRKFTKDVLDEAASKALLTYIGTLRPLFPDIRTEIRIIGAQETKGILRTDAPNYIVLFSEAKEGYLVNAGFLLQQLDLYLSANGIGNCYQGMAKLVKGVDPPSGKEMVMAMSFGRPAEPLHRQNVSEFKRRTIEDISSVKGYDTIMEAARLAPSGLNNQSWYFTGEDGTIHAYAKRSLMAEKMNHINVGIALCHMWLAAEHLSKKASILAPNQTSPAAIKGYEHVASLRVD